MSPKGTSNSDSNHLSPRKQGGLRPVYSDLSRSGSEPDSLLDLYGRPRSHVDSMDQSHQTDPRDALYLDDEDPEHSRWIHRDKLALIESHEMKEAGFKLPLRGRSNSKSNGMLVHYREQGSRAASRNQSQDQNRNGSHDRDRDSEESKAQKPLRQADGSGKGPDGAQEPDLQGTKDSLPSYRQQGLRSGSSRIPVPKSSPLPISQGHPERNTPFTRKRGTSGNWSGGDEDSIIYGKPRRRSHSVGSQALLDDSEPLSSTPSQTIRAPSQNSSPSSPSKRPASNSDSPPSSSNARKATMALRNASDSQKPRSSPTTTYRSASGQRPKSRSGLESRPATAINRPEGDPPWLATMFKPDPRLPPDQQLLPTHAKRLQQEREASLGSKSISSSSPLNGSLGPLEVRTQLPPPSPSGGTLEKSEGNLSPEPGWPLKASPTKENGSPGGGANDHGGYSTIPKVQNAPTPPIGSAPSPQVAQRQQRQQQQQEQQQRQQAAQVKEDAKKEKAIRKEGGCGCCAIM